MRLSNLAWRILPPAFVAGATIVVLVYLLSRDTNGDIRTEDAGTPVSAEYFDEFSVFWLGESFEGSPLDVEYAPLPDAFRSPFIITYGSCGAAFISGCDPDLVIKTQPGCLVDPDPNLKIRERPARLARHLEVESGDTVVTIYAADAEAERRAADQMVHLNPNVAHRGGVYEPSQSLSGSLCEVVRNNPRPTWTPYPTETSDPGVDDEATQSLPATVLASFGAFRAVNSFAEAQRELGWKIVTTYDPRYTLINDGAIRQYEGEPGGLEQIWFELLGSPQAVRMNQAPMTARQFDPSQYAVRELVGTWQADVWRIESTLGIRFESGRDKNGVPIMVSVSVHDDAVSMADLKRFVASLEFVD